MQGSAGRTAVLLVLLSLVLVILPLSAEARTTDEREDTYHNNPMTYLLFSFVMSFSTVAILTSLFTFKYGQKRSKTIAVPMLLFGMITWGTWILFNFILKESYPDDTVIGIIHWVAAPLLKPLMVILGVILGAGLAVFIFLTVIVRS
ncbi:MAG: hypothetical protein U9R75_05885 [Candidatus Thermoplasmatota archaeon]|nr:hypothetical protein [Candidatus Thermoplasmatota archaeon]